MADQQSYSQFARLLLDEIGARALLENEAAIASNQELAAEIAQLRSMVNDETMPDSSVLSSAFGLVELFVQSNWDALVSEAYADYQKMLMSKTEQ